MPRQETTKRAVPSTANEFVCSNEEKKARKVSGDDNTDVPSGEKKNEFPPVGAGVPADSHMNKKPKACLGNAESSTPSSETRNIDAILLAQRVATKNRTAHSLTRLVSTWDDPSPLERWPEADDDPFVQFRMRQLRLRQLCKDDGRHFQVNLGPVESDAEDADTDSIGSLSGYDTPSVAMSDRLAELKDVVGEQQTPIDLDLTSDEVTPVPRGGKSSKPEREWTLWSF